MKEIYLRLFGGLKRFVPDGSIDESGIVKIQDDFTVEDLIRELNISLDETKVIMVNGKPCSITYKLEQNDRVAMFPAIVGG
jgi:sulfur carrier protein ThiS